MAKLFANSGDPDQTPHSAASDLGLHCLPFYGSPDYNGLTCPLKGKVLTFQACHIITDPENSLFISRVERKTIVTQTYF